MVIKWAKHFQGVLVNGKGFKCRILVLRISSSGVNRVLALWSIVLNTKYGPIYVNFLPFDEIFVVEKYHLSV